MTPDGDGAWTFDHVNFHVAGEPAILKFFADVLGWQPGHRPPFPFPGTWLYQGQDALVHLVATQGDAPELVFSHIAFRTTRDAADVLAKVRESGMPHRCSSIRSGPPRRFSCSCRARSCWSWRRACPVRWARRATRSEPRAFTGQPARRAYSQPSSAIGRARLPASSACAEDAVPSTTRFMIPCRMPAMRNML